MLRTLSHWLPPVILLAVATALYAQPASSVAPGDPLDARAPVPTVTHASSLAHYRKLTEEPVISWREANETVSRIGGWRTYAREAAAPDLPPVEKPPPTPGRTQ
ncbi:MAG: hypothetical protein JJE42_17470 [Burkholderiales bacterium]|nr:hypothetical protein [Burkholderiales bacterium]